MSKISCEYHRDRDASEKCERCGKTVCLECAEIYRNPHRRSRSSSGYHPPEIYTYCPVCLPDAMRDLNKPWKGIFALVSIGLMMLIGAGAMLPNISNFNGFQVLFPFFWIGGLGFAFFQTYQAAYVKYPKNLAEAERKKKKLLQQIKGDRRTSGQRETHRNQKSGWSAGDRNKSKNMFCQQCGHQLDSRADYCTHCGHTTADEKINHRMY